MKRNIIISFLCSLIHYAAFSIFVLYATLRASADSVLPLLIPAVSFILSLVMIARYKVVDILWISLFTFVSFSLLFLIFECVFSLTFSVQAVLSGNTHEITRADGLLFASSLFFEINSLTAAMCTALLFRAILHIYKRFA